VSKIDAKSIKILKSKDIIEIWEYEKAATFKRESTSTPGSNRSEENRAYNLRQNKHEVMRLANANFNAGNRFLTLTFKDTEDFNVRDIKDCNKQLKKGLMRIKYRIGDFKYLAVPEFQDEKNRGAVHYHMLTDISKYIHYPEIYKAWGLGGIYVVKIKQVDNVGAYISSYITKAMNDERMKGVKSYIPSRGLDRPEIIKGGEAWEIYQEMQKMKEVRTSSYTSEYQGQIIYKQYNLSRTANT